MTIWNDEQETLLKDCMARRIRMTEWERDFIASIEDRVKAGDGLSDSQNETLNDIWDKVTEDG